MYTGGHRFAIISSESAREMVNGSGKVKGRRQLVADRVGESRDVQAVFQWAGGREVK